MFDCVAGIGLVEQFLGQDCLVSPAALGAQMHFAPRVFTTPSVVSGAILPHKSVFAGCLQSVAWIRAALRSTLDKVSEVTPAQQTSFVDDIAHFHSGSHEEVVEALALGALALRKGLSKFQLKLSGKSVLVTSKAGLSKQLQKILLGYGISVVVCEAARDRGLLFNPTGKRNTVIQKNRHQKASRSLQRLAPLVSGHRWAGKVARGGPVAAATWGNTVVGMPWSQVKVGGSSLLTQAVCQAQGVATLPR